MFEIESINVNSFPKTSFDRVLIIQIFLGGGHSLQHPQNPSSFYIAPLVLCYKSQLHEKSLFRPLLSCIRSCNKHIFTWPHLTPAAIFFGMEICINTSVFWMFSGKKGSVRGTCYKLYMSFWYSAVVELKNFGFSCVIVGLFFF